MSIATLKLLRPQAGDIVIVDFNKVNITQVENVVKDMNVAVIAIHDINTIKIFGMREQKDFSEKVQKLLEENSKLKEQLQENRIAATQSRHQVASTTLPSNTSGVANTSAASGLPLPTSAKVEPKT